MTARLLRRAAVLVLVLPAVALAQSSPPGTPSIQNLLQLPPDQLQQLMQSQGGSVVVAPTTVAPSVTPQQTVLPPSGPAVSGGGPSTAHLEEIMSSRADAPLKLFGYDQIAGGQPVVATQMGGVQDDYILGQGDQIDVTLRGQNDVQYRATVDRDGRVILPGLSPIAAGGRSFGDFRRDLANAVHRAFTATEAFVSVAQLRQMNVLVVGEVRNPGTQTLTGLSTVVDALNLAGGIKKSGSLRNIMIVRGRQTLTVDLYSVLLSRGPSSDLTIAQGDRIIVPAIGATVAITGDVRRPAIYELRHGEIAIGQRELTTLANGTELPGVYREMVLRIRQDGKEELVDTSGSNAPVRDGEILFVNKAVSMSLGRVTLVGPVRLPGGYSLDRAKTLHDLLPSADSFIPSPYMLLGLIQRIDPTTLQRVLIPFSPLHVLQGRENQKLISNDVVHVLTIDEMRAFVAARVALQQNNSSQQNGAQQGQNSAAPSQGVGGAPATGASPAGQSSSGVAAVPSSGTAPSSASAGSTAAPTLGLPQPGAGSIIGSLSAEDSAFFGSVLSDYTVTLSGAVRDAGVYLVAPGTTLDEVLAAANGLTTNADVSAFEITSTLIDNLTGRSTTQRKIYHVLPSQFSTIALRQLDVVSFHKVFTDRTDGQVQIGGEVRYPGSYSILRGERLSEVLVRAGGLTSVAYPYGTVFLRQSLAAIEQQGHKRIAEEMEQQVMSGLASSGSPNSNTNTAAVTPDAFVGLQTFINDVRSQPTIGRMAVLADPSVLAAHPEKDPMLEAGDSIYIPQRPSAISVLGDVMQPGSYQFDADADMGDYIRLAGGYGNNAMESMTFIVYPDGTAESVQPSWLHFTHHAIPPGSVIYVPRDLFPPSWLALTVSVGEILKDFAISAASIAVIGRNN